MKENFKKNKTLTMLFLYYVLYLSYLIFNEYLTFVGFIQVFIPLALMLLVFVPKLNKFCVKIKKFYVLTVILYIAFGYFNVFKTGFFYSDYIFFNIALETLNYFFVFGVIFDAIKVVEPKKELAIEDINMEIDAKKQKKLDEYKDLLERNVLSESEFNELKDDLLKEE